MKYTRENTGSLMSLEHDNFEFFWGHHKSKDGKMTNTCLSQWWFPCYFKEDDIVFHSMEQYMMYKKAMLFGDSIIAKEIMKANHPSECKKLGRKVKGFVEKVWLEHREHIVIEGNMLKFWQNEKELDFLLSTGDKILVEASPYDPIWGIKMGIDDYRIYNVSKWKGLNLLGFSLMQVRDNLRISRG